ncbi:MAG TPA: MFS transporter [Cryomorphaceae bacterium]|nr:MFS transporter [Cryomorphaceae bacterium]
MSAFVGAIVGFERSLLPVITSSWGIEEAQSSLIMVATFGISKAVANLFTGHLLTNIGRKWSLVVGWCIAATIPYFLLTMNTPLMAIAANVALGLSQGITWSTTVIMKIDIVGKRLRGTAMGLNESAGYLAVGGASALAASFMDTNGDFRYILITSGVVILLSLLIALLFLPDTRPWALVEAQEEYDEYTSIPTSVFAHTSWKNSSLRLFSFGGLVNNANDGILWALVPVTLLSMDASLTTIGFLTGIHAASWGLGQLFTGPLSNKGNIKKLCASGMILQSLGLFLFPEAALSVLPYLLIGIGTALVYPTFLVGISNNSHPIWRPKALATYRFCRDMGYVFGALTGFAAGAMGYPSLAYSVIALLTLFSGISFLLLKN